MKKIYVKFEDEAFHVQRAMDEEGGEYMAGSLLDLLWAVRDLREEIGEHEKLQRLSETIAEFDHWFEDHDAMEEAEIAREDAEAAEQAAAKAG